MERKNRNRNKSNIEGDREKTEKTREGETESNKYSETNIEKERRKINRYKNREH
jgi:hypothetical protein